MPRIRIDHAAAATGALLVGLYTMIASHLWARHQGGAVWSIDRMAIVTLCVALIYGVLFLFGAWGLRRLGWRKRVAFVALGAACALPAFVLAVGPSFFTAAWAKGTLSLAIIRPLVAGAIAGFIYRRRAGFEIDGDDPATLADAVDQPKDSASAIAAAGYFDGPVQVRTSLIAALVAALVGAGFHVLIVTLGLIVDPLPADAMPPTFALPGRAVGMGIVGLAIPYLFFVLLAHWGLRTGGRTGRLPYLLVGILTPVVLAFALAVTGMGLAGFVMTSQFMLPSALAMLAYRGLAGVEPLALPDDVEVSDRRTLVGADHVRRRVRRVIDV